MLSLSYLETKSDELFLNAEWIPIQKIFFWRINVPSELGPQKWINIKPWNRRDYYDFDIGQHASDFRTYHPIESIYLVLIETAFLYYKEKFTQKQICLQSYWNLFRNSLGDEGVELFLVFYHFKTKNWIVRNERWKYMWYQFDL